ncbi:MarR family transcriptional regulator [Clostridium scatologenes]|uniref:MarR family transcriptional regulator n=2 Tax=Clostridium scatologenes TaxID=1548 RepID=A0A0E3JM69_CLOSL|nr:MarR family transcriptional regulator [Clostridium scatologenes]
MWRLYPKEKALKTYTFIIEEENRNIQACINNFNEEEKKLVSKLIKKMRKNIENDWKEIKIR